MKHALSVTRSENFAAWYQDVIAEAEMAEHGKGLVPGKHGSFARPAAKIAVGIAHRHHPDPHVARCDEGGIVTDPGPSLDLANLNDRSLGISNLADFGR